MTFLHDFWSHYYFFCSMCTSTNKCQLAFLMRIRACAKCILVVFVVIIISMLRECSLTKVSSTLHALIVQIDNDMHKPLPNYHSQQKLSATTLDSPYTNLGKIQCLCHCLLPILKQGRYNALELFTAYSNVGKIYCLYHCLFPKLMQGRFSASIIFLQPPLPKVHFPSAHSLFHKPKSIDVVC